MDWLDPTTLDAIYEAAVSADLVDRDTRAVLLQSVDDDVRLALPDHARPDRQYRSDLQRLNRQPDDGPAPLRAWLREAATLAEGRAAAAVFAEALARPDASPTALEPTAPAGPQPEGRAPTAIAPWMIAAGVGAAGLIAALALGGGDDTPVDAGPPDRAVVDGGRPVLRPVAVKLADASRGRPAMYRIPGGAVTVEDADGPVTLRVPRELAWSRGPVTASDFASVTGSAPPAAPDAPASGHSSAEIRAYCDALSRSERLRPFYAEGGDGYRLPTDAEWVFVCVGGASGPPAPVTWGLQAFGPAEAVAIDQAQASGYRVRGGSGAGIAGCTARYRPLGAAGAPSFRIVRSLSSEGGRAPLGPLPER